MWPCEMSGVAQVDAEAAAEKKAAAKAGHRCDSGGGFGGRGKAGEEGEG